MFEEDPLTMHTRSRRQLVPNTDPAANSQFHYRKEMTLLGRIQNNSLIDPTTWPACEGGCTLPVLRAHTVFLILKSAKAGLSAKDWVSINAGRRNNNKLREEDMDPFTSFEIQTLRQCVVREARGDDEYRWAGPNIWCRWMGLQIPTNTSNYDDDSTPFWDCEGMTIIHGKPHSTPGGKVYRTVEEPCGVSAMCPTCNTIIESLGRAWHFPSAKTVAVSQAMLIEMRMRVHCQTVAWPLPHEVHRCSKNCSFSTGRMLAGKAKRTGNVG